jgi:hypothetical protein
MTTPVTITKPVDLVLGSQISYSGPGIASGLIHFMPGADGSILECVSVNSPDGAPPRTCGLTSLQTSSAPMIVIGDPSTPTSRVNAITIRNLGFGAGNQVTDVIKVVAYRCTNNNFEYNSFRNLAFPSVSAANVPTGCFIDYAPTGASGAADRARIIQNEIRAISCGVRMGTTGGGGTPVIESNIFANIFGPSLAMDWSFDAAIVGNNFVDNYPAANGCSVQLGGPRPYEGGTVGGNHWEQGNQRGADAVIDLCLKNAHGVTIMSNTFAGNTAAPGATYQPDHAIDIDRASSTAVVMGNYISSYRSYGTVNRAPGVAYFNNQAIGAFTPVLDPGNNLALFAPNLIAAGQVWAQGGPLRAKQQNDLYDREMLAPGGGLLVGDGAAPPQAVITDGRQCLCSSATAQLDGGIIPGAYYGPAPQTAECVVAAGTGFKHIARIKSSYAIRPRDEFVGCDAARAPIDLTLPPASGSGRTLEVKKLDRSLNGCTVSADEADRIDDGRALSLWSRYQVVRLVDSDAGVWSVW